MWEIYKSGSVRDVEHPKGNYTMSTRQDPIIEEIRKIRYEIENECHNDTVELIQHVLTNQKKNLKRIVSKRPKLRACKKVA
jgi:hypothetical protein